MEEVEEGGRVLFKDIEFEEVVELVGVGGIVGRGVICNVGLLKMELEDDDMVVVLLGVEGWYN